MSDAAAETRLERETPKPNPLTKPEPWDLVAEGYDGFTRGFLAAYTESALERLQLVKDARVVDVACGPGTASLLIAPHVAHVDALDFSVRMLVQLRQNLEALKVANVAVHEGDGQALPFADTCYDVAVSMFGLMFFPDRPRGFAELFRVLKPGGRMLVSSWAPIDQSTAMQAMFGALRAADPSRPAPERDAASLENPELFRTEVEAAGFVDVRIEALTHGMDVDDVETFWNGMVAGAVHLQMLRRRLPAEEWERQERIALDYLRGNLRVLPARLESVAYLAFGRRP